MRVCLEKTQGGKYVAIEQTQTKSSVPYFRFSRKAFFECTQNWDTVFLARKPELRVTAEYSLECIEQLQYIENLSANSCGSHCEPVHEIPAEVQSSFFVLLSTRLEAKPYRFLFRNRSSPATELVSKGFMDGTI